MEQFQNNQFNQQEQININQTKNLSKESLITKLSTTAIPKKLLMVLVVIFILSILGIFFYPLVPVSYDFNKISFKLQYNNAKEIMVSPSDISFPVLPNYADFELRNVNDQQDFSIHASDSVFDCVQYSSDSNIGKFLNSHMLNLSDNYNCFHILNENGNKYLLFSNSEYLYSYEDGKTHFYDSVGAIYSIDKQSDFKDKKLNLVTNGPFNLINNFGIYNFTNTRESDNNGLRCYQGIDSIYCIFTTFSKSWNDTEFTVFKVENNNFVEMDTIKYPKEQNFFFVSDKTMGTYAVLGSALYKIEDKKMSLIKEFDSSVSKIVLNVDSLNIETGDSRSFVMNPTFDIQEIKIDGSKMKGNIKKLYVADYSNIYVKTSFSTQGVGVHICLYGSCNFGGQADALYYINNGQVKNVLSGFGDFFTESAYYVVYIDKRNIVYVRDLSGNDRRLSTTYSRDAGGNSGSNILLVIKDGKLVGKITDSRVQAYVAKMYGYGEYANGSSASDTYYPYWQENSMFSDDLGTYISVKNTDGSIQNYKINI